MLHDNVDTLWSAAIADCMDQSPTPSRAGPCRRVLGYRATLLDTSKSLVTAERRGLSPYYAAAELLWYLSGESSADMVRDYAPSYEKFCEEDGNAWGAYGARWNNDARYRRAILNNVGHPQIAYGDAPLGQLQGAIDLLRQKPDTRQAVVSMWNAGDLVHAVLGDRKDLPRTLNLVFEIHHGKLHACTMMRSNDAWLGMPYDIFCFTAIQRLIAAALEIPTGQYTHMVADLHLYERDVYKAKNDNPNIPSEPAGLNITPEPCLLKQHGMKNHFLMEKEGRNKRAGVCETNLITGVCTLAPGLVADCVRLCVMDRNKELQDKLSETVTSPALREIQLRWDLNKRRNIQTSKH